MLRAFKPGVERSTTIGDVDTGGDIDNSGLSQSCCFSSTVSTSGIFIDVCIAQKKKKQKKLLFTFLSIFQDNKFLENLTLKKKKIC